jgi:3-carboxy-cis,cis-muconate cycloisomerase
MTNSRLIESLATTDALAELFSDVSIVQAMLDCEAALARAAGRAGVIPENAAEAIAAISQAGSIDVAALVRGARASGTPVPALVRALTEKVAAIDPASARFVHWGATSQDVSDTALVIVLTRALPVVRRDHIRIEAALRGLAETHASTVMLGRTLLQPAVPITFGLKAAGWYAAVDRSWTRLEQAWAETAVLQLGGAAGTRAALGPHAGAVATVLARELGLRPAPPWHTDRDRLGALLAGCGLYTAALGKVARDIALLMQAEIGELREPGGGSSTMPQKRNPAGCAVVLAAATRIPGLVSAFLTGMVQEHERSVGGLHAEWPSAAGVIQSTGGAAASLASVLEGLSVDTARMRHNIEATDGVIYAERAVMLLAPRLGRDVAERLVASALERVRESGSTFGEVLRAQPEAAGGNEGLADLERPEAYLGDADAIRRELLGEPPARRTE